jgi:DNA adenine methylase
MSSSKHSSSYIGPFLKWVGGKSQLLGQFRAILPESLEGRGYIEPFLGCGAVFFDVIQTRKPARCTLLDINPGLVNLFVQVRDGLDALLPLLQEHRARHNDPLINEEARKTYYYSVRALQLSENSPEAAARFLYLNKTCFNGLHRQNRKGQFNVPMGNYKSPTIFDVEQLKAVSRLLQGVRLEVASFQDCERFIEDGDFVYLDPPYEPISVTSSFTSYAQSGFSQDDQRALKNLLQRISSRCQWMASNSTAAFIEELYAEPGMYKQHVLAARAINSVGEGRGKIKELVISNYRKP